MSTITRLITALIATFAFAGSAMAQATDSTSLESRGVEYGFDLGFCSKSILIRKSRLSARNAGSLISEELIPCGCKASMTLSLSQHSSHMGILECPGHTWVTDIDPVYRDRRTLVEDMLEARKVLVELYRSRER